MRLSVAFQQVPEETRSEGWKRSDTDCAFLTSPRRLGAFRCKLDLGECCSSSDDKALTGDCEPDATHVTFE